MNKIDKPLTQMQKDFAEKYVEDGGSMANYQIAIAVGYSEDGARQRAYELLSPDICPHVVRYIEKLKAEMAEKYKCDFNTHQTELWQLKEMAKKKNNVQSAIRAEELRGKAAGLYVERQMIASKSMSNLDNLSEEELQDKLENLKKIWGDDVEDEDK